MKSERGHNGSGAVLDRPEDVEGLHEAKSNDADVQKRMEAAATPGPAHKALEAFVGDWKAEVKCWSEQGTLPHVSQATASARWKLNGHFLEEEFHGEMMGKPFTGLTVIGYDNTKQTYNTVWLSDMQTAIFTSEGKGEKNNTVLTLEGKSSCPATGRKDIPMKTVYRTIDRNKRTFEMFNDGNKTMEITYTRK